MAAHLESLASHYDQMATALRESEAGEEFNDEDIHGVCSFFVFHESICRGPRLPYT
jgi:hypothetical protein